MQYRHSKHLHKTREIATQIAFAVTGRFSKTVYTERSKELRSWMTSAQKPADAKQLRENFVPSFGKSSFDLQIPKLDPSMARRLKEMRGGEASKAEAKEKALAASQYKILDIAKSLLYLWGTMTEATSNSTTTDPLFVKATESALQLWGHAFHSIAVQRRENVLPLVKVV